MHNLVSVNPFRCRMWSLHDRLENYVTEETCRAEMESFSRHGQMIPVLGRPLRGDSSHDIELIYGARRLFVARQLNLPLKVELRTMSNREALIAMDIENRHRKDLSPYERGLSYAQFLREGYFGSQDDIVRTLKVSPSQVSRLLKLARLPSVIIEAFGNPFEICETWGLEVYEALEDAQSRPAVIQAARAIARLNPRPSAKEVYRQLMEPSQPPERKSRAVRNEVVKGYSGAPLFRIRHQGNSVTLLLPVEKVSAKDLSRIGSVIADILQETDEPHASAPARVMGL
jgi:ParB family chromosome partitioning protein